jgi:hypothetical protein
MFERECIANTVVEQWMGIQYPRKSFGSYPNIYRYLDNYPIL